MFGGRDAMESQAGAGWYVQARQRQDHTRCIIPLNWRFDPVGGLGP